MRGLGCAAHDLAGTTKAATATYVVVAWTLAGFRDPVAPDPTTLNVVKGCATVPLKFEIFAGTRSWSQPPT